MSLRARVLRRTGAAEKRGAFFDRAAAEAAYVSVEAEGLSFVVSTRDEAPGRRFFVSRNRSEFAVLRKACELVEPHGVFLDVGANVGTTTLVALRWFERAIAIEAEPRNAALLRANVALNGAGDRVAVREAAATDAEGEVGLRISAQKHGGHSVGGPKAGKDVLTVAAVTLDGVVAKEGLEPSAVGMIWIDVEGHEARVLEGAPRLLAAGVPVVVEARARSGAALQALVSGSYARFVDLRDGGEGPSEGVASYLDALQERGGRRRFTDLLLIPRESR